ncbi:type II toxin-antitoxin system HicA family toxin [Bacteroidota bacterium]
MTKLDKFMIKLLSGTTDSNIPFNELINLLTNLGFESRVKGSHYIFYKDGIKEIINIQSKGNKVKPYQVKQVRNLILKYNLLENE